MDVVRLEEIYRALRVARSTGTIAIGVALLSVLLLSAAGIYALMSFTVAPLGPARRGLQIEPAEALKGE